MKTAGLEKGVGIISAAFAKDPTDPQWAETPEYKEWLGVHEEVQSLRPTSPTCRVAIGYSYAQTLVAVLKACGDNLTRENIMKQAANLHDVKLPMLLPGITLSTSADRFRADQADAAGKVRRHHLEAVRRRDFRIRKLTPSGETQTSREDFMTTNNMRWRAAGRRQF